MDEESSDDTRSVLTGTAGRSSRPLAAQGTAVGLMNKVTSSSKKWIQSKKKKPRKKKQNGPKEMPSNSEKWDNFFKKARSTKARKRKKNIKTIEEVREEEEEERLRLQSAAYYELNKPTKEWVFNSHLLDDDDEEGMYKTRYKLMCKNCCIVYTNGRILIPNTHPSKKYDYNTDY